MARLHILSAKISKPINPTGLSQAGFSELPAKHSSEAHDQSGYKPERK